MRSELYAVKSVVFSDGSEVMRREYLRRGNIHPDWNLDGIGRTSRRQCRLGTSLGQFDVELAYWWAPELVMLAHSARLRGAC